MIYKNDAGILSIFQFPSTQASQSSPNIYFIPCATTVLTTNINTSDTRKSIVHNVLGPSRLLLLLYVLNKFVYTASFSIKNVVYDGFVGLSPASKITPLFKTRS